MTLYRTRTIKRARRSRRQLDLLDLQILGAIGEDHPQSVRHIFYRMTDPRLPEPVEKSDRGYRHVQDRIVKLRRAGRLPYGWIADASRRGYHTPTYRNAGDFLRGVAGHYRADLWQRSDFHCEVWTESRSIAGVIQADCEELAVSLYPAGGFSSISLAYQAAEYINAVVDDRDDLDFHRLAIQPDQIARYDLPTKPRKATDRRSPEVVATVEAEAMPAGILRALLRDRVEALLPERALHIARVAEAEERAHLGRVALLLDGGRS